MLATNGAATRQGGTKQNHKGLTAKDCDALIRWAEMAQPGARLTYFVPSVRTPSMARDCPRAIYNIVQWLLAKEIATPHYIGPGSGGPAYIVQRGTRPWIKGMDAGGARQQAQEAAR